MFDLLKSELFSRILRNRHTTGAAVLLGLIELVRHLTPIWWPQKQAEIDATIKIVQKMAIGYGLLMAGDASRTGIDKGSEPKED